MFLYKSDNDDDDENDDLIVDTGRLKSVPKPQLTILFTQSFSEIQ